MISKQRRSTSEKGFTWTMDMPDKHLGKLPPRYGFILNPHTDMRLSRCPLCRGLTFQRKFALVIHIDCWGLVPLGKTCRWCSRCELIMVHQDELENILTPNFLTIAPEVIGNTYLVMGTMDMRLLRRWLKGEGSTLNDILDNTADFKKRYDLQADPGGWRFDPQR